MNQYPAEKVFNVGVFSHGGAGRTTLVEAMLFDSGATSRRGRVSLGTTASDTDPEEIKRHISLTHSVIPIEYNGCKINVIDTPDFADFGGDVRSAMRVVDAAIILVDASSGVEVGTEQVWHNAELVGLPRLLFVNKMDREHASFRGALEAMIEAFGKRVAPLQFPIGEEENFRGIVDLLGKKALVFTKDGNGTYEETEIPAELADDVEFYRQTLVEAIAEHNEELTMRYLEGEEIGDDELSAELHKCFEDGSVVPMVLGAASENLGIQPLMQTIIDILPSAAEHTEVADLDGEPVEVIADPNGDFVALAFKTQADPHVGKVTWFRVYSGTLKSSSTLYNVNKGRDERVGQLFFNRGKDHLPTDTVTAGDIGGVSKLESVETGDTITSGKKVKLDGIRFPHSVYSASIHAATQGDLDKLSQALQRMQDEDPSLVISRDPDTGDVLVSGMGEPHVQIAVERMKRRSNINVSLGVPRVPYRETIAAPTKAEYKHKKQTGGAGQYGHVHLALEPLPDADFEFADRVVGGAVPKNFFPAVEKGIRDGLAEGPIAGFPVVNIKATLYDGSYHDVDSNEMAFRIAAKEAFKKGIMAGQPTMLEPVMNIKVQVTETFMGDVMSDLNTRRGQVTGMDTLENGTTVIEAQVPGAEIQRYATDLRSMTQGRGTFEAGFSHYQAVPHHLVDKIVAEYKKDE
ncbi:MAG: elongation factor G [Thermomicrobiales bacterium]|nr:elongation factor G [Thermomicrobiales bacterium]MCO5228618.1 elongation factor G [Thermomicrobiales bacterium]